MRVSFFSGSKDAPHADSRGHAWYISTRGLFSHCNSSGEKDRAAPASKSPTYSPPAGDFNIYIHIMYRFPEVVLGRVRQLVLRAAASERVAARIYLRSQEVPATPAPHCVDSFTFRSLALVFSARTRCAAFTRMTEFLRGCGGNIIFNRRGTSRFFLGGGDEIRTLQLCVMSSRERERERVRNLNIFYIGSQIDLWFMWLRIVNFRSTFFLVFGRS